MKKTFFLLIIAFFCINAIGETFVVSGMVTLNDKGVENAKISVLRLTDESSEEGLNSQNVEMVTTSNSVGRFHFNLRPGKYKISCDYTSPVAVPDALFAAGPDQFELINESIEDLKFKIVDSIGFIEANKSILEEIAESVHTLNYKWGMVPVFSEEECKLKAAGFLDTLKDEDGKDVLNGATLGLPLKIYDMTGNVVFYQFPITNLDTRIGYIGVHSVGIKPEESNFFNYPSISLKELNDKIINFRSKNFLMDNVIPEISMKLAKKMGISK
ncbi:MAG: carboxypeptidase regulatory-like domain-containing protein, partial [Candidatus Aminicenantes bacterium]|nr:carboxypeptidase regulatory-like domain-containing protein [Candidatus Aminicenantes bacterium]